MIFCFFGLYVQNYYEKDGWKKLHFVEFYGGIVIRSDFKGS
jgi:hypothetical protein